jgi:hypothetical protein
MKTPTVGRKLGRGLVSAALVAGAVAGGTVVTAGTAGAADVGPCTGNAQPTRDDWAAEGKRFEGTLHYTDYEKYAIRVVVRFSKVAPNGVQSVYWHGTSPDEWAKGVDTQDIQWANWDRASFTVPKKDAFRGDGTAVLMPQACDQQTGQVLEAYSEFHVPGKSWEPVLTFKTKTGAPLKLVNG